MAVTATLSDHFKYQVYHKQLDLGTGGDSIKAILMRNGFSFNAAIHGKYANVMPVLTRTDISFTSATKRINTVAGSFITAGFVAGGQFKVTGSASNNSTFTIASVDSANQITVNEAVVDEIAGASDTLTGSDELATGYGYTQYAKGVTGQALAEDDGNNRAQFTCDSIVWTAAAGSIGPTPSMILVDDTSADKTIIGCIDFGGNQTAGDGSTFTVSGVIIRLS